MKKNFKYISYLALICIFILPSCKSQNKEVANLIIKGGTIYTVNENEPVVEAVAVFGNKIIFTGKEKEAMNYKGEETEVIDLENKIMIPGIIDSHGHFSGMGNSKLILDLTKAESYEDLLNIVEEAVKTANPGEWIEGRGWHQDKWSDSKDGFIAGFPTHHSLSEISAENPVILTHASGHSTFVNKKAMELAGISPSTVKSLIKNLKGGEIMLDKKGEPTGILNENAENFIYKVMPKKDNKERMINVFDLAIEECNKNGITGFHDAGIGQKTMDLYMR